MNAEQKFESTDNVVKKLSEMICVTQNLLDAIKKNKDLKNQQSNKDWETVEVESMGVLWEKRKDDTTDCFTPEWCWSKKYGAGDRTNSTMHAIGFKIHSLKRLSDGEVFTVREVVNGESVRNVSIEAFEVDSVFGLIAKQLHGYIRLSSLQKIKKQPLFKTEDGKDIYEGDAYWYINYDSPNPNWKPLAAEADKQHEFLCPIGRKQFSSIQATRDYIILNEPVLSFSDVISICSISDMGGFRQLHAGTLKKLAQSKITKP